MHSIQLRILLRGRVDNVDSEEMIILTNLSLPRKDFYDRGNKYIADVYFPCSSAKCDERSSIINRTLMLHLRFVCDL